MQNYKSNFNTKRKNLQGRVIRATDGRMCGVIRGDTFEKKVLRSRHFFRRVGGYGVDKEAWENTIKPCCNTVLFREADTGKTFSVSVSDFDALAIKNIREYDRYGAQIFFPLEAYLRKKAAAENQPELFASTGVDNG